MIRRATLADAAALTAMARETFVDAFGADNRPEDMDAYVAEAFGEEQQRREIADPNIVTLVACYQLPVASGPGQLATGNGQLIAYAQLRRTGPQEVELARFYVRRAHHGHGLAQELMAAVKEHARAMGATRGHIATQFLLESASMGVVGGIVGASIGVLVVVGVSFLQVWSPVLDPAVPLLAPAVGGAIGLLSGLYPAYRAARLEPAEAVRH